MYSQVSEKQSDLFWVIWETDRVQVKHFIYHWDEKEVQLVEVEFCIQVLARIKTSFYCAFWILLESRWNGLKKKN